MQPVHNKLRGVIGKKKFFFLIGWRLLIFGRILMKFFVLVYNRKYFAKKYFSANIIQKYVIFLTKREGVEYET